MTIKKLSMAAILTIGIAASTMSLALAEESMVYDELPVLTGAACPLAGCHSEKSTCNKCSKPIDKCSCKEEKKKDCDSCKKEERACGEPIGCDKPSIPACANCPTAVGDCKPLERQVYAYPENIYSNQQYMGSTSNGLAMGDRSGYTGVPLASGQIMDSSMTGAAAGLPVISSGCNSCNQFTGAAAPFASDIHGSGVTVDRDSRNLDNAGCFTKIESSSSREIMRKSISPFDLSSIPTGAAAPLLGSFYPDVPSGFWANCDISRLTELGVVVGYPDGSFKPNKHISRAEIASMITKGLSANCMTEGEKTFKDVHRHFWARNAIDKAVTAGLMAGYPDGTFKPNKSITTTEAMTILSHGINCPMDECTAESILSKYTDGSSVPGWAKIPVAKVLDTGALKDSPHPTSIHPSKDASRAEMASMLQNVRVAMGLDTKDTACACPITTGGAAFIEKEQIITIPTLQLKFGDEVTAKSAQIGDKFAATTLEDVTINGCMFPCGSTVRGKVVEVVRPTKNCQGALKLVFNTIEHNGTKADLPRQMLNAEVNKAHKPNGFIRTVEAPFTWVGGIVGITGRTLGGMLVGVGNAAENLSTGVGVATGETFRGQFKAAGRSLFDAGKTVVKAPVDFTRTALSGTMGLFQYTGDELTYLVDPNGMMVSSVNPKEKVTISFGCQ